jgi:hypothetical protein
VIDPAEVWRRLFLAGCMVVFVAVLIAAGVAMAGPAR